MKSFIYKGFGVNKFIFATKISGGENGSFTPRKIKKQYSLRCTQCFEKFLWVYC
jgi:hypothetical protein